MLNLLNLECVDSHICYFPIEEDKSASIEDLLRQDDGLGKVGPARDRGGSLTSSLTSSTSGSTLSSFNPQPTAAARRSSNARSRRTTVQCSGGEANGIGQALSISAITPAQDVSSRPRPRRVKMQSMPAHAMSKEALDFFGVPDVIPLDESTKGPTAHGDEEEDGGDQEEKIVTIRVFAGGKDHLCDEASDQQSRPTTSQTLHIAELDPKPDGNPQCVKPSGKVESSCQCCIL